ncbi:MAG: hypothetical protein QQN61_07515 [Nitrosopumilus sp.]
MNPESSKKIDEIIFETSNKISAIVDEIRLIKFSNMNEKEKQMSTFKECSPLAKEKSKIDLIQSILVVGVPLVIIIEILLVFNMT